MKVAIHQPQYWPWPAYIHKVLSSDVFVYLDTVQYSKNGLQNRNQIKTQQKASWLTLPVTHSLGQSIQETKIADTKAAENHWKTLSESYGGTPGFRRWGDQIHSLLQDQTLSLCDFAIGSTEWMLETLGVETKRVKASELSGITGHGSKLVASICQSLGATTYLTGSGATVYMDQEDFAAVSCEVWIQEWNSLEYQQAHPEIGFLSDLSTLDLLLNCPDTAMSSIKSAGSWSPMWKAS
jgi:hypothetical protein